MVTSYEDVALWHERDISHSAAERLIAPDATALLDYMLNRFKGILANLTVFEDNMLDNINKTYGVIFSQRFMLKLIEKGWSREQAYDLVQPNAIKSWEEKTSFKALMEANDDVRKALTQEEIDDCFNPKYQVKNVDVIYKRVGLL
jgi:adenylosuccinate lyase